MYNIHSPARFAHICLHSPSGLPSSGLCNVHTYQTNHFCPSMLHIATMSPGLQKSNMYVHTYIASYVGAKIVSISLHMQANG